MGLAQVIAGKYRYEFNQLKMRYFPGELQALPKHSLPAAQVYQNGTTFLSLSAQVYKG